VASSHFPVPFRSTDLIVVVRYRLDDGGGLTGEIDLGSRSMLVRWPALLGRARRGPSGVPPSSKKVRRGASWDTEDDRGNDNVLRFLGCRRCADGGELSSGERISG
jgi:hypothetical protein